jgi:predicted AAA+ superfamily ATPase
MYERILRAELLRAATEYPVVTIVGPRQSGKTTLARACFPDKPYTSLENPDVRAFAQEDPRGFLAQYPDGAIFDEFQRVPDLLSYLQGIVDEDPRVGRFILTGSQHFLMMRDVSQSLAGRTALLTLLPLSLEELGEPVGTVDELLYSGFYPRIHAQKQEPFSAHRNYFMTYVERDVRSLQQVHDLPTFETFVRMCAGRVGQLLNLTALGNAVGISATTARDWLHLLETSFIAFRLQPYHANFGKRLIKTPKLYFYDVGLAAYLCGIEAPQHLTRHPLRGAFFENMVIVDLLKNRLNGGRDGRLLFYRDSNGREIDLLYPLGPSYLPIEIKSSQTIHTKWFQQLEATAGSIPSAEAKGLILYAGEAEQKRTNGVAVNFRQFHRFMDQTDTTGT